MDSFLDVLFPELWDLDVEFQLSLWTTSRPTLYSNQLSSYSINGISVCFVCLVCGWQSP